MLAVLKAHRHLFAFTLVLLTVGVWNGVVATAFSTLVFLFFLLRNKWNDLLVFFIFIFILSDNYSYPFATTIKPVLAVLLFGFLLLKKIPLDYGLFKWFLPFFIIAAVCLLNSISLFTSFQKTVSYALLMLAIPTLMLKGTRDMADLIRLLAVFYIFIIAAGIIFNAANLAVASLRGGRPGGLFGNPNGLGIFCFLATALVTISYHLYPKLFSRQWKIISYAIIALALFMAASRGGILSAVAFAGVFLVWVRKQVVYFFLCAAVCIGVLLLPEQDLDQEEFNDYMRLNQENVTSGRDVAWQLAREEIDNGNYWFSKGFGYAEHYMKLISDESSDMGHQGNVHNSYLTIWLDTGLFGLILFVFAWLACFVRTYAKPGLVIALFCGVAISTNVESWLAASLNPFTISLIIMLCIILHANRQHHPKPAP
jgi:O-antigen ligase